MSQLIDGPWAPKLNDWRIMINTAKLFGFTVMLGSAMTADASSYNLGALIAGGGTVEIGDKVFSDFGFQPTDPVFKSSDVTVTPSILGGVYSLKFEGPWTANAIHDYDIVLQYAVATKSGQPLISMIEQSFTLRAAADTSGALDGLVVIGEEVRTGSFFGSKVAQSTVSYDSLSIVQDLQDPPAEDPLFTGDNLNINPAQSKLYVAKDIYFGAFAGSVSVTSLTQSFHQDAVPNVPDSGLTLAMLGLGIGGLGLVRRSAA